ncbi:MAG: hypothetical protein JXR97_11740, partial [Planctomycetes bacterium]|nr:hypothetical protein [Planctomycetota bacterium]
PARKKFMKSASSEVAAVSEVLTRIALAYPGIGLRLLNDGRLAMDLPAHSSLAERISALFGKSVSGRLLAVDYDGHNGYSVAGFCAKPPESRANSRGIYTFLNKRWIRHAGLARVIRDAYQGALPPRRYPFAVLYLNIDPSKVDVNVHPTKEEVRFENDRLVIGGARRAVDEALNSGAAAECVSQPRSEHDLTGSITSRDIPLEDVSKNAGRAAEPASAYVEKERPARTSALPAPAVAGSKVYPARDVTQTVMAAAGEIKPVSPKDETLPQQGKLLDSGPKHKVLAQAGNRYLVVESPDGIKLVDQHALHERWNYERLLDREHPVMSQKLILPVVVELSPSEASLFEEALPVLHEAGFEVERFGVSTLSVSAAPEIVRPGKIEQVIRDVFGDIGGGKTSLESIREHVIASLACRSAVLFGQSLPFDALVAIMDKFYQSKRPLTCPHGRPTTVTITWDELERRFGRA